MCGIFGIVVREGFTPPPLSLDRAMRLLFTLSESRGKEAAGIAVLAGNRISVYKDAVPASELIRHETYRRLMNEALCGTAAPPRPLAMMGHSRLVTDGMADVRHNNQPVIAQGIVGIHNGIIVNPRELWSRFPSLKKQYEIDTEVLLRLIAMFRGKGESLSSAMRSAFGLIEGAASIALLFDDLDSLLLATNTGSLYLCETESRRVTVFASERYILDRLVRRGFMKKLLGPHAIRQLRPGNACVVNLNDLALEEFPLSPASAPPPICSPALHSPAREIFDVPPVAGRQRPPDRSREERFAAEADSLSRRFPHDPSRADGLRRCTRCILPETMPFIEFDGKGVCNYCRSYARLAPKGEQALMEAVAPYRGRQGEADCIVPISGGRDSSYCLHYVKNVLGMNPIAYTYDWGMVTDLARRNIARLCGKLGVEHILVSADIRRKRDNIRKNVEAWLRKPELGMVPLFMAGDKHYFYYLNVLKKRLGIRLALYGENRMERTDFKVGFCGVREKRGKSYSDISAGRKIRLAAYYARQLLRNPAYFNRSLLDSLSAFLATYAIRHDYIFLYDYIPWKEEVITALIRERYGWEVAGDTTTTWRIGDGTASFYNYIYYAIAGFTENDTFRSNQIREGLLTRDAALTLARQENRPRFESILWYCNTIGIDSQTAVGKICGIPRL